MWSGSLRAAVRSSRVSLWKQGELTEESADAMGSNETLVLAAVTKICSKTSQFITEMIGAFARHDKVVDVTSKP